MVKKLKSEDFLSELANFYKLSESRACVYLTFKRAYEEKHKYKNNKNMRKQRLQDRLQQNNSNSVFNVLVRAKLKKQRIQTILTPSDIDVFHKHLINVLMLNFITQERTKKLKGKAKETMSKTKKRKLRKLKRAKKLENKENKL